MLVYHPVHLLPQPFSHNIPWNITAIYKHTAKTYILTPSRNLKPPTLPFTKSRIIGASLAKYTRILHCELILLLEDQIVDTVAYQRQESQAGNINYPKSTAHRVSSYALIQGDPGCQTQGNEGPRYQSKVDFGPD